MKITIIGGGSSIFVPLILRRIMVEKSLEGCTVSLMDIDSHRVQTMHSLAAALIENEGSSVKVESTLDQREALTGANYVITAISVGGMAAWESDIEIPGRYGVFMYIADSLGPGGIFRAFRNIPVLHSVCRDLAEVSPNAMVLNYTNPATASSYAMGSVAEVRSLGLCTGTRYPRDAHWLAELAGVAAEDVAVPVPVAGLNHCTAITEVRLKDGTDLLPVIRARSTEPVMNWIIDTWGVLPYLWWHWTEFFPQLQKLEEPYAGRAQGLAMRHGRRIYVMEEQRQLAQSWEELARRWAEPEHHDEAALANLPKGPQDEGIEVVDVITAIVENRNEVFVVIAENEGAIGNMPSHAVVEVPAVVNTYGIHPLRVGELPEALAAHMRQHSTVQELTAQAALTGDRNLALQVFLLDPLLEATLDTDETARLLDEMLAANAEYLPQFSS